MGNDHDNGQTPDRPEPPDDYSIVASGAHLLPLSRTVSGVLHSFDLKTPAGKAAFYACRMGEALKADEFINTELLITDVMISPAQSTNADTGELERWARCVVVLADGRRIAFGSVGVLKSLSVYCDCFSPPPWNPPAKFHLRSTPIGKNRWYELVGVNEPVNYVKPRKG